MAEVCKTDLIWITKQLDILAAEYASRGGQANKARRYYVERMSIKLKRKLKLVHDYEQESVGSGTGSI